MLSLARNSKLFGSYVGRLQKEYKLVYSLYVEILNYTVYAQQIMLSSGTLEQSYEYSYKSVSPKPTEIFEFDFIFHFLII